MFNFLKVLSALAGLTFLTACDDGKPYIRGVTSYEIDDFTVHIGQYSEPYDLKGTEYTYGSFVVAPFAKAFTGPGEVLAGLSVIEGASRFCAARNTSVGDKRRDNTVENGQTTTVMLVFNCN